MSRLEETTISNLDQFNSGNNPTDESGASSGPPHSQTRPQATGTGTSWASEPQPEPAQQPQPSAWPPAPTPPPAGWPPPSAAYPTAPPPQAPPMDQNGQPIAPQQPTWPPAYNTVEDQSLWYAQPGYQQPVNGRPKSALERAKDRGGIVGGIATLLLFLAKAGAPLFAVLAKFKILLILGKLLLTFGSMFISIFVYSFAYGWPFAIGFVVSIFVHECGHAIAGKSRGIPISNMVFIPFMGAAVMLKRGGRTVGEDAFIGIMGPVFGMLYALACLGIFFATKQPLFLMLAYAVAFMNLLNLLPIAPLDGGWIVPVFSPKILALGAIFTIPVAIWWHNPFVLILGLLSLPRIIGGWKVNPAESAYFKATSRDRWTYAFAYPAIALALAGMMSGTHTLIQFIRAGGII